MKKKLKLITIVGARPQFIKAAVFSYALKNNYPHIEEVIIHTGQHYDSMMNRIFFTDLSIPEPKYHLDLGNLSHGQMTGRMIEKIEEILLLEIPDWLILYGDTNSTLAGAISASKLQIKICHIEAGLRSFNMKMPEEINRILTDNLSTLLACPSNNAIGNLKKEGFRKKEKISIINSGDIMKEGVAIFGNLDLKQPNSIEENQFILCTIHRQENTDDKNRLTEIFRALRKIATKINVVIPLHPRTKKMISAYNIPLNGIEVLEPIGYFEMIKKIREASLVMTDSGGLQKEAYYLKKYCITLRDETEWVELVKNDCNALVGSNYDKIISAYEQRPTHWDFEDTLYGNCDTSELIIEAILNLP